MAQYRQSGAVVNGAARNGDHVSVGVRGGFRHFHHRRSRSTPQYKISISSCVLILSVILSISAFFYFWLQIKAGGETSGHKAQDDDLGDDKEFLLDIKEIQRTNELRFGRGSVVHAGDSRYWDKDDRRRDEDYSEEESERSRNDSTNEVGTPELYKNTSSHIDQSHKPLDHRANGLYNEAGRNELKMYEAQYEASLNNADDSKNQHSEDTDDTKHTPLDDNDEYDDGIDFQDDPVESFDYAEHDQMEESGVKNPHDAYMEESLHVRNGPHKTQNTVEQGEKAFPDAYHEGSQSDAQHEKVHADLVHSSITEGQSGRKVVPGRHSGSKKKSKRRKFSGCEMKVMNSSTLIVEPFESRKFARFSLRYTEREEKPDGIDNWEPRFAGHQSLREREDSFIAHDQNINCGFVQGPQGSPSTGFDLAEDDARYISSCHIAVSSCIFGNSDRLRSPIGKTVSRQSKKNVCFVMFMDEVTLQTLSSEGHMPDMMGFIGLWKIVVVKNLPYADMRRVGKIPKFLPHRLFPSARYSIWLDSKLRLQLDPMVILEYFLWRKGHEYAISNHYDRHCLWEEVAQNKKLNKYNHSVIDEQFAFYQADGMRRFNASDPKKLLPSNVPEGSFIVRAHTPMSNLFSCLWFNEVNRFTPRDQLSFAYTYHKLRRKNPEKTFYLNMFKDCERRRIAKLYHHRSEEKRNIPQNETE